MVDVLTTHNKILEA